MMKVSKFTLTLIVLLGAVVAIGASRAYMHREGVVGLIPMKGLNPRAKGNPSAFLKITEYIDYQCGACRHASGILHEYLKKYPGKIFLEVRSHPLSGHRHGELAAVYAQCAVDQGNFWPFHDFMFERQPIWTPLPDPRAAFRQAAADSGLNLALLDACVESPAVLEKVRAEKKESASRGVVSTPSFFFNDTMVVGPQMLLQELDKHFPHDKPTERKN